MTYVAACIQETSCSTKKIQIVDADLEAPGVSFWLDQANQPLVSFVQLLEALHYPPRHIDQPFDFFADELRKTSLSLSGLQQELFILPAALDLAEIQDMPVTPEHLARNPANPWQLADHLHALRQRLGADAAFIDLRAGLSELASPILFDPRVDHFFVTTVAPQSVEGMSEVLHRRYQFNLQLPRTSYNDPRPTVIMSLLTKELRNAEHYVQALSRLNEAYPPDNPLTSGVQWLEAEFLSTLMSIGSLKEALDSVPQSHALFARAAEWATALYASPPAEDGDDSAANTTKALARKLQEVCHQTQFAEMNTNPALLATEPLLNLGKHYAKTLPSLLMIGAKGAGKTFTFRQMIQAEAWQAFLEKLGFDAAQVTDATLFALLWSSNIADTPDSEIKSAQRRVIDLVPADPLRMLPQSALNDEISKALESAP